MHAGAHPSLSQAADMPTAWNASVLCGDDDGSLHGRVDGAVVGVGARLGELEADGLAVVHWQGERGWGAGVTGDVVGRAAVVGPDDGRAGLYRRLLGIEAEGGDVVADAAAGDGDLLLRAGWGGGGGGGGGGRGGGRFGAQGWAGAGGAAAGQDERGGEGEGGEDAGERCRCRAMSWAKGLAHDDGLLGGLAMVSTVASCEPGVPTRLLTNS